MNELLLLQYSRQTGGRMYEQGSKSDSAIAPINFFAGLAFHYNVINIYKKLLSNTHPHIV